MLNFDVPCVQRKAVQKLLQQIGRQLRPGDCPLSAETAKGGLPQEVQLLVEQCGDQAECCEALVSLVVAGQLEWRYALGQLLGACTAATRHPSGAVAAVGRLLTLHMQGELQAGLYRCPFVLRSHPLVLVLRERPDCWDAVLQATQEALHSCSGQEEALAELLRPLLVHCLAGPSQLAEHISLRLWLWLALAQHWPRWLRVLLPWMPLCEQDVRWQLRVLEQLLPHVEPSLDGACSLQALAACLLALDASFTCGGVLRALLGCLRGGSKDGQRVTSWDEQQVWDACLVLTAMLLARAPGSLLADILDLCEALLERRECGGGLGSRVSHCLALPLCQLVQQQQLLPRGLQGRAAVLLGRLAAATNGVLAARMEERTAPSAVTLASSHPLVAGALFAATCLHASLPKECVERWRCLRGVWLPGRDSALLGMLVASAALLGSQAQADARVALDALRQEVDACTQLAPCMLPLLLHVLGRSRCPETLALVLRSLADTANHKYALGPLWSGVRALSGHHPSLAALCLSGLATLCVRQPQALPMLLQAIGENFASKEGDDLVLAKAQAIGVLLQHSASQHGANLLRPLVSLVTSCHGDRQGAAVVQALRCLHQLCAAEVVNVKTTLSSVVPKLWKDGRPLVVRAVCELMAVVPAVSVPTVEYERYEQETAGRLWRLAVAPESHPAMRGGAFRALAAFPPSCHSLKQLPPEAKVNLKIPASKTPLDLGRSPEELLTYTPGHCFLDLLATIEDEPVMHDYGQLLSSLVRHEVAQLPRSVYMAPRATPSGGSEASAQASMGDQLNALYEANRFPAIQGSLAVGILLTYEPTQLAAGARVKLASSLYKIYLHQLPSLLQDVPLDGGDWARCLSVVPAWGAWVRRAFRAAEEHRRLELKDDPHAEATSCLWARDMLTEAIKANCSGRASQQGNALLALGALLEATAEHLQGLDTGARRQAGRSHTAWAHALLDLLMDCCGLPPPTQARQGGDHEHFQWLLKASSGMLVRGCAAAAAGGLVALLHRRDPHCLGPLLETLAVRLQAAEGGPTGQALTGAGLAACVVAATRLGLVDAASVAQDGSVRSIVLRFVEKLMSTCLQNSMCEPKAGQLLCLALCLCSLGRVARDDEMVRQMVISGCTRFCQDLHEADPDACSFEVRCVCTSLVVCTAAQGVLSLSNVEELLLWFEKRRQEDPQCQGTALSVGLLVRTLVERAHPKGPLLWASLLPHWTDTLLSQSQPTLSRLAALRGLCVMLGASGPLVVSTEAADEEEAAGSKQRTAERRQLQEQLLRLLSRSSARDVVLSSCAAWALGHLSAGGAHSRRTAASVPSSYSYLGDASVLRPLVDFLATSIKAGSWNGRVGACLSSLDQDFGRSLPPLNWTALLAPLLRECPSDTGLADLMVSVALRGAPSSPAMAALLAACAAPPLLRSLPGTCVERLLCGLPAVVRSTPSGKLAPFLELAASRALRAEGLPILQGVESLLGDEGSELPPGTRGAISDLLAAVARGCQGDVWDAQQRAVLPVLGRCVACLAADAQGALLDALEALPLLLALHCHLAAAGKAPPGCDIFAMASNLVNTSDKDHCQEEERVLWLLSQCLHLPEPATEEAGRQVRWFIDCLVAVKETALQQDHQLLRFQLRVLSLIVVMLARTQPLPVCPLSATGQLASDLWLLLPEALATLLLSTQPCWRDITAVVLDRLSEMVALEVPSDVRHLLLSCACRLRSTPEFNSAWTQLLTGLRA